jgi:DNA repair exonuclease SbcCD ATPase subunit
MIKRSEMFKIIDDYSTSEKMTIRILDAIESAGVEFAPEELSEIEKAKKKYEDAVNEQHDNDGTDHYPAIVSYADHFHKVLQARIADLESQVNIIADENQRLEKRIEEKDAETARLENCYNDAIETIASDNAYIKKLKEPVPESPELAKAKNDYYSYRSEYELQWVPAYIAALESDNARLRGAGKPVVDGSNTEID